MSEPARVGWLLINKGIVWRSIHSTLRGRGGLEIIKPCVCHGGLGRWQGGVARSWETRDCFDSASGGAAVFARRPASQGFGSGPRLSPAWPGVSEMPSFPSPLVPMEGA